MFRLLFLPVLLALAAPTAALDLSGIWKGAYSVDSGEANAVVTVNKAGDKYTGSIALTDENINVAIRSVSQDDDYFAVSGVLPSQTPDGAMVQAHFTFGGFVDPEENVWEGNWTVTDKDGNVAGGNLFMFTREAGSGKPPGAVAAVGSMAGRWRGTYTQTNKQAGSLSIDLRESGGGYAGDGQAVDNDGTKIPPITLTSGTMTGNRFAAQGTMTLIADDGAEYPATVGLTGDVNGDAWRGNILVRTTIDGEETAVISGMFRLERGGGPTGFSGGGMSGKGKVSK